MLKQEQYEPNFHFDLHSSIMLINGAFSSMKADLVSFIVSSLSNSYFGIFKPNSEAKSAGFGSSFHRCIPFAHRAKKTRELSVKRLVSGSSQFFSHTDCTHFFRCYHCSIVVACSSTRKKVRYSERLWCFMHFAS